MMRLVEVIDQALGYVPPTAFTTTTTTSSSTTSHSHSYPHNPASLYHSTTIQEKWIDNPQEYLDYEKEGWKVEGERAVVEANETSLKEAREREVGME